MGLGTEQPEGIHDPRPALKFGAYQPITFGVWLLLFGSGLVLTNGLIGVATALARSR